MSDSLPDSGTARPNWLRGWSWSSWRTAGLAGLVLLTLMVLLWQPGADGEMSVGEAIVLGIVEGLTEYLPVSSTGHLILAQRAMGMGDGSEAEQAVASAFAICIQAGAIVAVLGLYARRVRQMAMGIIGRDSVGRKLGIEIIAAFIPAAILGLLGSQVIKDELFNLWAVVIAWAVGGAAILIVAWRQKGQSSSPREGLALEQLSWKLAVLIGVAQCLAMWPGVSRSLVTIVGGVLVGLSLPAAVEFSFLLGVVTLGAATCYDGLKYGPEMLAAYGPMPLAAGFIAAWISAVVAVKWMVTYLKRHGLSVFGYYRVALAAVVAVLIWLGWLAV